MPKTRQQDVNIPHFAVPFTFTTKSGHAAVNEQGRYENQVAQAKVVLGFPVGSRMIDLPEFGHEDILFRETNSDIVGKLTDALVRWIPTIDVEVEDISDLIDQFITRYRISISTKEQ